MGRLQEREATREFMKHGKVRSLEAFPRKKNWIFTFYVVGFRVTFRVKSLQVHVCIYIVHVGLFIVYTLSCLNTNHLLEC